MIHLHAVRLRCWNCYNSWSQGAAAVALGALLLAGSLPAQENVAGRDGSPAGFLDPSRGVKTPVLERTVHKPLAEQYIWTAAEGQASAALNYHSTGIDAQTEPHFFRAHFRVAAMPREATLYIAGPRSVSVWVNGKLAERVSSDTSSPLGMHVFATAVGPLLRAGDNTLAIRAVRGRGVAGYANSALVHQQTFGQVMVAKIIAAGPWVDAPDLMHSDGSWRGTAQAQPGWEQPGFADAAWQPVLSLGGIEGSIDLFQWNADAGLYNWPGYDGISGFLAHMPVPVAKVLAQYDGRGGFEGVDSLTSGEGELVVHLPAAELTDAEGPSLFLDFGKEVTGRLEIVSSSGAPITATVQLGESEAEALKDPYLGVNQLTIAAHGTGHSPKSAFRYAKVRFLGDAKDLHVGSIHVDHTFYPVQYAGSFESSDALLNRIWETGAYTAHLCMQDDVWDASKRDRGRWMGDTDVSGPVIEDVFGDKELLEDTLDRLMGPAPVTQQVNGIPGYSSFWFTGVADFYRHTGDKAFLEREHARMLQLLALADGEFDGRDLYANPSKVWLYVDWSPDFNGDTPETHRATTLEFLRAYREAAFLLGALGDTANQAKYTRRAQALEASAAKYLVDPATGTFGPRWQTNAAAVISGAAKPGQYPAIWRDVLSHVGQEAGPGLGHGPIITPYYGDYVLRAMATMNHRPEALAWMRQFWGGMLAEGATSFWEAYDVDWYKGDFHASLKADNGSGYFVSLAHGWSAGPTAWLMEEVLGIQPTGAGFSTVRLRPDLAGLAWARGGVPTPHGPLKVDIRRQGAGTVVEVDLPEGVRAEMSVPAAGNAATVQVNGVAQPAAAEENNSRRMVTLAKAGHYRITE